MTVKELKEKLEEYIENLDRFDDDREVVVEHNTYFVHGDFISITGIGFVELEMEEV